jgi:hypothetical protein
MAAPPIHHVNLMDTEDDILGYLSTLQGVPSISGGWSSEQGPVVTGLLRAAGANMKRRDEAASL